MRQRALQRASGSGVQNGARKRGGQPDLCQHPSKQVPDRSAQRPAGALRGGEEQRTAGEHYPRQSDPLALPGKQTGRGTCLQKALHPVACELPGSSGRMRLPLQSERSGELEKPGVSEQIGCDPDGVRETIPGKYSPYIEITVCYNREKKYGKSTENDLCLYGMRR